MPRINTYMKALVGCVLAFLGCIQTGLADGQLSAREWVTAAMAACGALSLVYTTAPGSKPEPVLIPGPYPATADGSTTCPASTNQSRPSSVA